MLRARWEEIPEEQRKMPVREEWPVLFIQAKKP